MRRIGLLSDTHGYLDDNIFRHFAACDEIWHAGDFGNIGLAERIEKETGLPLRGVYGNIDGQDVRAVYPEKCLFNCEGVTVFMQHIGGYPKRYAPGVKQDLVDAVAKLFISGHSHILRIMFDESIGCLHINPGAAGNQGWHQVRTLVRFSIDGSNITNCEVIELGKRGSFK